MHVTNDALGMTPTVFVSFNNKSVDFVDCLDKKISPKSTVIRYEAEVGDWESFESFMDSIKQRDFAVLVISDEYLKSNACMYEVCRLMEDENWTEKAMFAVMPNANIYNIHERVKYIGFWVDEHRKLEAEIKEFPKTAVRKQQDKLEQIERIRDTIGEFLEVVADKNNPRLYAVMDAIYDRIELSKKPILRIPIDGGDVIALGKWYVQEFLKHNGAASIDMISEASGLSKSYLYKVLKEYHDGGRVAVSEDSQKDRMVKVYSLKKTGA